MHAHITKKCLYVCHAQIVVCVYEMNVHTYLFILEIVLLTIWSMFVKVVLEYKYLYCYVKMRT